VAVEREHKLRHSKGRLGNCLFLKKVSNKLNLYAFQLVHVSILSYVIRSGRTEEIGDSAPSI